MKNKKLIYYREESYSGIKLFVRLFGIFFDYLFVIIFSPLAFIWWLFNKLTLTQSLWFMPSLVVLVVCFPYNYDEYIAKKRKKRSKANEGA